jgi:hypothetical protein
MFDVDVADTELKGHVAAAGVAQSRPPKPEAQAQ